MNNLVKYHLFKIVHDKGMGVIFGVLAFLAAAPAIGSFLLKRTLGQLGDFGELDIFSASPVLDVALGKHFFLLLMLVIAVTAIVYADEKHGYVKNIIGQCKHKSDNFLSKCIALAVVNGIFFVCYMVIVAVCEMIFNNNSVLAQGSAGLYLARIGILFLLIYAFTVFVAMLTALLRKRTAAMLIGLALLMGAGTTCLGIIDMYAHTSLVEYAPTSLMSVVANATMPEELLKGFAVGVVLLIGSLVIGCVVTEKRDAV